MLFGYIRCSTKGQEEGSTLEEQERVIKGLAMARGISAYDLQIFTDAGVSGSIPLKLRPAGDELLSIVKAGDTIVASKLDRMFRNSFDALKTFNELKQKNVHLILFDLGVDPITGDSGTARLIFQIMSAFADHERVIIRERILGGKRVKKAAGGHTGGEAPYGWRIEGKLRDARLTPVEEEQALIQRLAGLNLPVPEATRQINEMGYRTRTGKPFQKIQVQRILARNQCQSLN